MADSASLRIFTSIAAWRIAVPAGTLSLPWGYGHVWHIVCDGIALQPEPYRQLR
jgi:hypothetical protein